MLHVITLNKFDFKQETKCTQEGIHWQDTAWISYCYFKFYYDSEWKSFIATGAITMIVVHECILYSILNECGVIISYGMLKHLFSEFKWFLIVLIF